jgi:hypothetical protein
LEILAALAVGVSNMILFCCANMPTGTVGAENNGQTMTFTQSTVISFCAALTASLGFALSSSITNCILVFGLLLLKLSATIW